MSTEFFDSRIFDLHSQKLGPRKANGPSFGQSGSGCLENIKVDGQLVSVSQKERATACVLCHLFPETLVLFVLCVVCKTPWSPCP